MKLKIKHKYLSSYILERSVNFMISVIALALDAPLLQVTKCNLLRCARARNNDERVAQGNDRRIPSQDVSRFRNSFAGRNKFLKDPTSARSATAGRKIPAVTLRDLDVVEIHDCTFWKFGPGGKRAG